MIGINWINDIKHSATMILNAAVIATLSANDLYSAFIAIAAYAFAFSFVLLYQSVNCIEH